MKLTKITRSGVSALVASASAVVVTAGIASAAPTVPVDPSFVPNAAADSTRDLVGVGSDTSENAMFYLANGETIDGTFVPGFNQNKTSARIATFLATGSSTLTLRSGSVAVTRPNGSTAGKNTLYGSGNNPDVSFARSSSAISSAEASAGLYAYPFALDTLQMGVSKTATNAPATLTGAQILGIYKGDYTNWSQVGGTAGTIKPLIPQAGSGTKSFFDSQMKALNGGVTPTYGPAVTTAQEHDDALVKNDPNAIAPFSSGRAKILGTIQLAADKAAGGWSADRAVYNVVRQADKDNASILSAFGENGFLCSIDARPLVEAGGFQQLATPANGGVCGQATQSAASNLQTNNAAATTTALVATSPAGNAVKLVATVDASGSAPDGSVDFKEGSTVVGNAIVVGGQATLDLNGVTAGSHDYTASFVPNNTAAFGGSSATTANIVVKESSMTNLTLAATSSVYGQATQATAVVTSAGAAASGEVVFTAGSWSSTVPLTNGQAVVALPKNLAVGAKSIKVTYQATATVASSNATANLTVTKAGVTLTESFPASITGTTRASGTVTVKLSPASSVKPTGKVTIKKGTKALVSGTLVNGAVKLKLPVLVKGKNTLTMSYAGSANTKAGAKTFVITRK